MRARLRRNLDANFKISNYFTAVELLIYATSASEHRSRSNGIALTYIDPSGERKGAWSTRILTGPHALVPRFGGRLFGVFLCKPGNPTTIATEDDYTHLDNCHI